MADGDDAVGLLKPFPFDLKDLRVDVFAAPVVFEGVDMQDEGLPADPTGEQGGGDGHPVVGVDDVEGESACDGAGGPAVADHLGDQIGAVDGGGIRETCLLRKDRGPGNGPR